MSRPAEKTKVRELGKPLRTEEFDLDESFVFCNSGSWSCVPRRFIDKQNQLIRERERNSQLWAFVKEPQLIWESLTSLAKFIGAQVENFTFVDNTTEGLNIAFKSQSYQSGDQILLCNLHSYNSVILQAKKVVQENEGTELVMFDIPFPIEGEDDIIDAYRIALEQHPAVKVTVISHITSETAVLFPIAEIIHLCHQHDVIAVVDGAHAPGHVRLTLEQYGADYYVGNLCKWMMLPQSVGFLWVHPKHQWTTQPLATSHFSFHPHFRDRFYSPMAKDRITQVLVKDAVNFLNELGGLENVSARSSEMVTRAASMLSETWNTEQLEVTLNCRAPHMALVAYPEEVNKLYIGESSNRLEYALLRNGVVGKACKFGGKLWCRISCNVWNDWVDYELLAERVKSLPDFKRGLPDEEKEPRLFIPAEGIE